jgi:ubiquitin carboxyl-terminal hydrolase 14
MPTIIKLKWGKEEYDVEVEPGSTVEVFKTQVWTITTVPVDRQKFLGFPGGMLKDSDDLDAKVAKLKPGAKITLLGTAEGGELKQATEKVVFEEDLSPEEKAKILKERKVEILPAGIKNLGNTCYMNSTLQCLCKIKELAQAVENYSIPGADERDIDAVLTNQFRGVINQLSSTTETITPIQFVMALRAKFPRFAEMQNGAYMQQDADECLRGMLNSFATALSTPGGNRIDELFSFSLKSSLKCLECDEEAPTNTEENSRVLICHLGTPTDPVSHIYQGISLSLKEHIEKNSPSLGRNAQYEKKSALASLPPYLICQFARFGFKGANEWAGTGASKVKLIRNIKFSPTLDLYDCATDDLKTQLSSARLKKKEQDDARMEADKKRLLAENDSALNKGSSSSTAAAGDVEMKSEDVEMKDASAVGVEVVDTGYYELVGIISHKGRTADGGHYVGWTLKKKADKEDKDDQWICYDDETTSQWNWKDITGVSMDLMGGKADTQISYINIYKKVTVSIDPGQTLGDGKADAAAAK